MKYQIIMADPPWIQRRGGAKSVRPNSSGIDIPYQTISLDEITGHFINAIGLAEQDHIMFLWTIEKYLPEAEKMAKGLGYNLHCRMVWNKVTGIPSAFTIRFGHEYLLYMWRGKFLPVSKEERGKIHSVFTEQVKAHSQKPEVAYQIIERLYPNTKKLEMYARRKRAGWDVWGNEVESDIVLTQQSLDKGDKDE